MCFSNEGDWYASVRIGDDVVCSSPMKCDECRSVIAIGEKAHTVFMQEHEECRQCDDDDHECKCEEPDFGETFEYVRCDNCDKFLNAIQHAEADEGCSKDESLPRMPMWEDLQGIGRQGCKIYWQKAAKMYPELVANGHLKKLWTMM